jgi:hypothetical protein
MLLLGITVPLPAAEEPARRTPKEALQAFNDLIGSWRGTGDLVQGTREEKQKGFWTETIKWEWQFKGQDTWLKADFEKGKHFARGELRYLPDKDRYRLTLWTPAKEEQVFEGALKDRRLTLERGDDATKESQKLTISLLHANRYLYRFEVKKAPQAVFTALYQVGATKEGVPFAAGDGKPECIVSGGLGTMAVSYKGKTYYVCCSGCRDAFNDDPEKYIREFEARKGKPRD